MVTDCPFASFTDAVNIRHGLNQDRNHGQGLMNPYPTAMQPFPYQDTKICPLCGTYFTEKRSLQRHMLLHSGKRPFKCDVCGKDFAQSSNMKRHRLTHRTKELS